MIKTLALVLKKQNLGETDRILTIFSPNLGKKRVVAKGIRKPLSKMAGHLDTFMVSQIILTERDELPTITSAQLVESFERLREDLKDLDKAYAVSRVVERVIIEDVPQQAIFQMSLDAFVRIEHQEPWRMVWLKFLASMSKCLGLGLSDFTCQKCHKKICQDAYFNEDTRNFICQDCGQNATMTTSANTLKLLQLLGSNSYENLRKIRTTEQIYLEAEEIMLKEITSWFNKPWQSYRAPRIQD